MSVVTLGLMYHWKIAVSIYNKIPVLKDGHTWFLVHVYVLQIYNIYIRIQCNVI